MELRFRWWNLAPSSIPNFEVPLAYRGSTGTPISLVELGLKFHSEFRSSIDISGTRWNSDFAGGTWPQVPFRLPKFLWHISLTHWNSDFAGGTWLQVPFRIPKFQWHTAGALDLRSRWWSVAPSSTANSDVPLADIVDPPPPYQLSLQSLS